MEVVETQFLTEELMLRQIRTLEQETMFQAPMFCVGNNWKGKLLILNLSNNQPSKPVYTIVLVHC